MLGGVTNQNQFFVYDEEGAEEGCIKSDAVVDIRAASSFMTQPQSCKFRHLSRSTYGRAITVNHTIWRICSHHLHKVRTSFFRENRHRRV